MKLRHLLLTASVSAALIGFGAGPAPAAPRVDGRGQGEGSTEEAAQPAAVERHEVAQVRERAAAQAPSPATTPDRRAGDRAERRWPGAARNDGAPAERRRAGEGTASVRPEDPGMTEPGRRSSPVFADEQRGGRGASRPRSGPQAGRAVPRTGPPPRDGRGSRGGGVSPRDDRGYRGGVVVSPRVYYYPRRSYPYGYGGFGLGFYYYDPYAWYPYGYPAYGRPHYGGSYYGGIYDSGYYDGELRLQVRPVEAEVYVDGYYMGRVDDFDGVFQAMRLTEGAHRVELVAPGFETLAFDVRIEPGRKINYRGDLRPAPYGQQPEPYGQQPPPSAPYQP